MKKTLLTAGCLIAFTSILTSCGTTKQVQAASDSYIANDEIVVENTEVQTTTENNSEEELVAMKKKKNAIESFFTFGNSDEFIKFDETTVFTKEISGLKEKKATTVIRYDNLMAGFGSYNSAAYYYLQFDKDNRAILAKNAEAYFSDFENKRLQRNGRHTERTYGKIRYQLNWGTLSSSTPNNGIGDGYCGYEFVKGSPYFTISNYEFKNKYYERAGDATTRESPIVKYYFTRSQLKQLLNLISEDNIKQTIRENNLNYISDPTAADYY